MLPDLNTLLLVRLGVDALIAVAFWGQMRRYPSIHGPGWWSLGAVLSITGSALLMVRVAGAGPLLAGLAGLMLFASHVSAWVGLRRYLRLAMPWSWLTGLLAVQLVLQVGLALRGDEPGLLVHEARVLDGDGHLCGQHAHHIDSFGHIMDPQDMRALGYSQGSQAQAAIQPPADLMPEHLADHAFA